MKFLKSITNQADGSQGVRFVNLKVKKFKRNSWKKVNFILNFLQYSSKVKLWRGKAII